ncbi:hypothetical protein [uncultured Dokdonia sp.]|uniref:hypothetical protein n=1 Tax=uncultured Dokdonia sp. TaxID=575653 RepID=UPI00261BEEA5|nr:hypothetical protein [uncultured Dokdonia sp.]
MKQTRSTLKTYFETGDRPTELEFIDLIDSMVLDEDLVGESTTEYSYTELNTLIENNALIVGKKYTIADYQTRYYIEGTNTTNINRTASSTGTVSGFAFFDPPLTEVSNGTPIKVVSLPDDYTGNIKVGDTATVTSLFSAFFMKFTNGLQNVPGAVFSFSIKRFDTIDEDAVILDANLKIMMKPNGVINTEVHDGTPYMEMTAEENIAVPTEKILVTAISGNTFSLQAESITFPGELLEYDFTDVEIKNEDDVVIGKRNGIVKRRISANRLIDVNKDWRVQRYRRYKLSNEDWLNYILKNPVNSSLYNVGGNHAFSLSNTNTTEAHRYILPRVENQNFYQDFTVTGTIENEFETGITNGSSIVYGQRMETVEDNVYKVDVNAVTIANGKDFFIFPLDDKGNPIDTVERFVVKSLNNTVVRNNDGQFSVNPKIDFTVSSSITDATFMVGGLVISDGALFNVVAIDAVSQLSNKGSVLNLTILSNCVINNSGDIQYLTIGGMLANATNFGVTSLSVSFDENCRIRNTIIGGKRVDRLSFSNTQTNKCLLGYSRGQYIKYSDSIMFLTAFKHAGDFYTNNLNIDTSDQNPPKGRFGFLYEDMPNLFGKYIFASEEGVLVYRQANVTDTGGRSLSTQILTRAK